LCRDVVVVVIGGAVGDVVGATPRWPRRRSDRHPRARRHATWPDRTLQDGWVPTRRAQARRVQARRVQARRAHARRSTSPRSTSPDSTSPDSTSPDSTSRNLSI